MAERRHLLNVIKYEGGEDLLVWKHPVEDFNLGSQLIVHESQEAIFFRDGQALDLFGPGRYTLETDRLPMLGKLCELPTGGESPFHSEVYFVNLATQMGVKWGTDTKVRLFDPASGLHVELGASGEFSVRVADSRKLLIKVVGAADNLGREQLIGAGDGSSFFRAMVMTQVKSFLAQTIKEESINILEIDSRLMELSAALQEKLNGPLAEYGLAMPEFYVSRIVTPDDDPNFRKMKEQYAEQYLTVRQEQIRQKEAEAAAQRKAVEAETAARMKIIGAQGEAEALKIQKAAEAEAYRMQAEAEAQEMKMKGYTYQQETSRKVGMEAMKNGIGGEGGSGALGDIAGLGIGLGAMSGVMNMTKDALDPVLDTAEAIGGAAAQAAVQPAAPAAEPAVWDCVCGQKGVSSKFCPNCGAKRPEPGISSHSDTWDCACGQKEVSSNFCPNCGAKRPEPGISSHPDTWDCACGQKGITGKFCPECGKKKGA